MKNDNNNNALLHFGNSVLYRPSSPSLLLLLCFFFVFYFFCAPYIQQPNTPTLPLSIDQSTTNRPPCVCMYITKRNETNKQASQPTTYNVIKEIKTTTRYEKNTKEIQIKSLERRVLCVFIFLYCVPCC